MNIFHGIFVFYCIAFFCDYSHANNLKKDKKNEAFQDEIILKVQQRSDEEQSRWSRDYSCYQINYFKKEDSGLITLEFEDTWSSKTDCPSSTIYDISTNPKSQVRGSNGINGKIAKSKFQIQLLPDTKDIFIELKKGGQVKRESFFIEENIKKLLKLIEAENSIPAWQMALNNTESKLAEKAKQDKTPPSILIDSPDEKNNSSLKTDAYTIFIKGKITDQAGVLKVMVAGKSVGLDASGTFTSKVKLGYGANEILVQAEDVNGNIAEKKIIIQRQEIFSEMASQDIDIPVKGKLKNSDAYAVVIGIEKYQYVPDAVHANNDAEVFREYLIETMGYKKENIKIITDRKATQAEIEKLLGADGWLARNAIKNKSDVVVYFSGHGVANMSTSAAHILPYDVDPNYSNGMQLKILYKNLAGIEAKSTTVYLDACFTGQTRNERLLVEKARPVVVRESDVLADEKITVISASSGSQISSAMQDRDHGIFTYYLLKGLRGEADKNKDKKIYLDELIEYVSKEVKVTAAKMGRVQTPVVSGFTNILLADIE